MDSSEFYAKCEKLRRIINDTWPSNKQLRGRSFVNFAIAMHENPGKIIEWVESALTEVHTLKGSKPEIEGDQQTFL